MRRIVQILWEVWRNFSTHLSVAEAIRDGLEMMAASVGASENLACCNISSRKAFAFSVLVGGLLNLALLLLECDGDDNVEEGEEYFGL